MVAGKNEDEKSVDATPESVGNKGLLENNQSAKTEESKYIVDPNGDTKIELEVPEAFKGLTKEELMKYNNDPFWVKLRWFLFILFWVGWLVMLIMAIVIIIQAPSCKPPPTLMWVEEQTSIEINPQIIPMTDELIQKADALGVESFYLPDLIDGNDFMESKYNVEMLIKELGASMLNIITDLPMGMETSNPLYENATLEKLISADGTWNFENEALPSAINKMILQPWSEKGVKGFLMNVGNDLAKMKFKDEVNILAKDEGSSVALASDVVDTANHLSSPDAFKTFLEEHANDLKFYKFNPNYIARSTIPREDMRLISMGLFLLPGSVMLTDHRIANETAAVIRRLSEMKKFGAVQFGSSNFANATDGVVAFTRTYKGTPAYAVALNFNDVEEIVSFEGTKHLGDVGTTELISKRESNDFEIREKADLTAVKLEPHEGVIIQFVANF